MKQKHRLTWKAVEIMLAKEVDPKGLRSTLEKQFKLILEVDLFSILHLTADGWGMCSPLLNPQSLIWGRTYCIWNLRMSGSLTMCVIPLMRIDLTFICNGLLLWKLSLISIIDEILKCAFVPIWNDPCNVGSFDVWLNPNMPSEWTQKCSSGYMLFKSSFMLSHICKSTNPPSLKVRSTIESTITDLGQNLLYFFFVYTTHPVRRGAETTSLSPLAWPHMVTTASPFGWKPA